MKKFVSLTAIMAALLLLALAASPVAAKNSKGEVIGVTGFVPGRDLIVHIIALVPPGADRNEVAQQALADQGARAITKEEFSTISLTWDQFDELGNGDDFVLQNYNPAGQPAGVGPVQLTNSQTTWTDVATSVFAFAYGGETPRCPSLVKECRGAQTFDGENDVAWLNLKGGNILGVTWSGTTIDEADMALNTSFSWATDGANRANHFDVETVFLHENGHALGLGHSADITTVMYPSYQGVARSLADDDIDGVTFKYPLPGPLALAITTTGLPDGTVESFYSATLTAVGGTLSYSWSIAEDLPTGLSLDSATGEISETPAAGSDGSYSLNVSVTDAVSDIDTALLSLTINAVPVVGSVTVSSIDYSGAGGKNNGVHLLIDVALSVAVADASVSIKLYYRNGSLFGSGSAATDGGGVAHFRATKAPVGLYTTEVTGVTGAGGEWDGLYPDNQIDWP